MSLPTVTLPEEVEDPIVKMAFEIVLEILRLNIGSRSAIEAWKDTPQRNAMLIVTRNLLARFRSDQMRALETVLAATIEERNIFKSQVKDYELVGIASEELPKGPP